jgi:hypothetical protein
LTVTANHVTQGLAGEHSGPRLAPQAKLPPSIQANKVGLIFSQTPSLGSWEAIGQQLFSIADSSTWWIADWLAFGEEMFKDRYVEAIRRTSLNYQTLRNYAWVARRFDQSRRQEELSFGHHAEVAALDVPEQDYWLRKAKELGWSRNQLRTQVRASLQERRRKAARPEGHRNVASGADDAESCRSSEGAPLEPERDALQLILTRDQITLFESVASARNMHLHEWAVQVLEETANRGALRLDPSRP